MSEEGCEIRYKLSKEKQEAFSQIILNYCNSEKSESDASTFKTNLSDLGIDPTYALSYEIYNCGFIALGNSQYELHFASWGLYWGDVMLPMLHQLGAEDIYAYAYHTSWGGDYFARCPSGETEYLYIGGNDPELDSCFYNESGDVKEGASFDQLYEMYLEGKLKTPDTRKTPGFRGLRRIVFIASIVLLIWYFFFR